MTAQPSSQPILLYDGLCGLCNGTVRFILRRDRKGLMRFATLQGEFAAGVIARHRELRGVDSLVLVSRSASGEEQIAIRSDAALGIARYLGGAWGLALAIGAVPRSLRDWAYDVVARFRYSLVERYDTCPVPSEDDRERFLG